MKRFLLTSFAGLLGFLSLGLSPATAQMNYPVQGAVRYPGWQTPLSPYLNMLNPGNAAANYYLRVLPEFERRQDRNSMFQSIQGITNRLPARPGAAERDIDTPLASTGHPTAFGYTAGYFGGAGGGAPGIARAPKSPFPQRRAGPQNPWQGARNTAPPGAPPRRIR